MLTPVFIFCSKLCSLSDRCSVEYNAMAMPPAPDDDVAEEGEKEEELCSGQV